MRVLAATYDDLRWLVERSGAALTPSARGIVATDEQGKTLGVVAFDCWTPASAQMHVALDSPSAGLVLIRPAFSYLFEQSGREVALGMVSTHNRRMLSVATRMGFGVVARVRDGWSPGVDLMLLEMRKAECGWLRTAERKAA